MILITCSNTIYIYSIHNMYTYIYSRSTLEVCLIVQFCCKSPVLGTTACKDWLCLINYRLRYHYYCCFLCSVRYKHTTPISRQQKTFGNRAAEVPKNTLKLTHWRRIAPPRIRRYFWFWSKVSKQIYALWRKYISSNN